MITDIIMLLYKVAYMSTWNDSGMCRQRSIMGKWKGKARQRMKNLSNKISDYQVLF